MSFGMQSMLKEGHKHLSGLDEAVLKNIDACKQLSTITRTSLGPNGNNNQFYHFLVFFFTFLDSFQLIIFHSDSKSSDFSMWVCLILHIYDDNRAFFTDHSD
jgi:hypothetical protein